MKKIGIIILISKCLYIHVNSKIEKIKSENKSEFRNVENRNSYDEKTQIQWSYEKENIKNALI